jgi:hypothetical protein
VIESDSEQWLVWTSLEHSSFGRFNVPDLQNGQKVRLLAQGGMVTKRNAVNIRADEWQKTFLIMVEQRRPLPARPVKVDCSPESTELCAPPAVNRQPVDCNPELTFSTDGPASGCEQGVK